MTTQNRRPSMYSPARTPSLFIATAALISGAALGPSALAQVAGTDSPVATSTPVQSVAQQLIGKAADLLKGGRVIRAQSVLEGLISTDAGAGMSDGERLKAYALMANISNRVKSTDALEVSLQRADLAVEQGDVRTADAQAAAVIKSSKANAEQLLRAKALAAKADEQRQVLQPKVPGMLQAAVMDYNSGRYAESKLALSTVRRSGVKLSLSQAQDLDEYQAKIVDLERVRGGAFAASANASVVPSTTVPASEVQPPAEEKPAESAPVAQPEAQPATQPIAQQPPAEQPAVDQLDAARRFTAQQMLGEADAALRDAKYNEAMTKYSRLSGEFREYLSPEEYRHATEKLAEARIRMGASPGPDGDPLGRVTGSNDLIKQQALAEYQNQQNQSRRMLDTGDTERAKDLALASRLTISNARNVFNEAEYETYQKQVDALLTDIDNQGRAAAERRAIEISKGNEELRRQQQIDNSKKAESRIREAFKRIRELQEQMDYDAALQVVNEQILFLDPINPAGLLLKDVLTDAKFFRRYNQIDSDKRRNAASQQLDNAEAMVPPRNIVDYPKDWPAVSARRNDQLAFNDTEENRRVNSVLAGRAETVDFDGVTLASALEFIRGVTKVNLDADWNSLESIGVHANDTVSLNLTNVPVGTILNKVLSRVSRDAHTKASWAVEDGVLTIASEDVIRQKTVTQFYDIKDLLAQVPNYTNVPSFDLSSVLLNAQSSGRSSSPFSGTETVRGGDNSDAFRSPTKGSTEDVTRAICDVIQHTIDPTGWTDLGGATGAITVMNGNLIIKNTPKNHQAISGLLGKLREIRAMQINVESRFLLVSQDFFEKIGFDLDVYFNANNNQVRRAQATDPTIQAGDLFNFNQGGLQRSVTGFNTFPNGLQQGVVNPRAWSPIGVGQNSSNLAGTLLSSEVDSNTAAGLALTRAPALGIAGQFLDDIQVDFLIQATQADRRSVRLNAPRLTFTNGQTSNIFVATQTAFISDLQPVVSNSAVGFDPTLSTISEGVRLLVEGTITADRRYVTMNVETSVSKLDGIAQFPVTAIAGGQLVNSGSVNSFIQAPTVTVTSVSTTVTVPDQGTILLGGQRLINEYEVESGVPVLSKIPILNRFFSNTAKAKDEQTLLILMKPTILIQNEQEDQNFPGLLDSLKTPFGG